VIAMNILYHFSHVPVLFAFRVFFFFSLLNFIYYFFLRQGLRLTLPGLTQDPSASASQISGNN
jgi:hypothetical protein